MSGKLLKKALNRPETRGFLQDFVASLGTRASVWTAGGAIVFGDPEGPSDSRAEICHQRETVGHVSAGAMAEPIARVVRFILDREAETRDLASETLEQYREIAFLSEISEIMANSSLELRELGRIVIEKAQRLIVGDNGSIMLLNEDFGRFEIIGAYGTKAAVPVSFSEGSGIVWKVLQGGRGEIINDVRSDPRYVPGGPAIHSLLCVPLRAKNRVVGVINISSESPVAYSARHLNILQTLASEVAVAFENANLYTRLRETFYSTVRTLAETIERRDTYTGGHTQRVMEYSLGVGEVIGLDYGQLNDLELVAVLHDVGKIGVSDLILLKPDRLTAEEYETMKAHSAIGSEILANIRELRRLVPGIRHHHEHFDGNGYPDGLAGEKIPLLARVVSVADTFDAMTSDRPYRHGLSPERAFRELLRCSGSQFDPLMIRAFISRFAESFGFRAPDAV
jgi:HD-GYP domain-containing protein (c-di-GMP phosphodiesterase class II)